MLNVKPGRRLAFDYGDVRIGVAISDNLGFLATPRGFLKNDETLESEITKLFQEYDPIYVAVGIPKHLSGESSAKESSVRTFINFLNEKYAVDIREIDERMTTLSANKLLQSNGKDSKQAKNLIDAAAAAIILESALRAEGNE